MTVDQGMVWSVRLLDTHNVVIILLYKLTLHEHGQVKKQCTKLKFTFSISVGKSLPSLIPLFIDIK